MTGEKIRRLDCHLQRRTLCSDDNRQLKNASKAINKKCHVGSFESSYDSTAVVGLEQSRDSHMTKITLKVGIYFLFQGSIFKEDFVMSLSKSHMEGRDCV